MYAKYIKEIDPKEGYYIEYFNTQFPDIMDRAREILQHRTREEIFKTGEMLDELLLENKPELALEELADIAERQDAGEEAKLPPAAPARQLAYYIEKHGVIEDGNFVGWTLEEYFAVLTLAIVGEAYCEQESIRKRVQSKYIDEKSWFAMGHYAVEAMEAVAFAESLIMSKKAEKAALEREKTKRSIRAKDSADAGHEKTRQLLQKLHDFYLEGRYTKYSEAVHDFLKKTPEEDYRHLAPTNRERTLRDNLSKIVRGIRVL
ncbi:MAG: hypothetical protein AB2817_09505 [Candidatus Thiodiazotropha sp.]